MVGANCSEDGEGEGGNERVDRKFETRQKEREGIIRSFINPAII